MRTSILLIFLCAGISRSWAQLACSTTAYNNAEQYTNPQLTGIGKSIEEFTRRVIEEGNTSRFLQGTVIKIPVVVHILYHYPSENISDEIVHRQIETLNKCFRRQNADTSNTPEAFKLLAADCEIEFHLATSDPSRNYTSGIVRKYTPIIDWMDNDAMKFSAQMGDDAWDASKYLNIWVCKLKSVAGYSSAPGSPAEKDGIVISTAIFGQNSGGKFGQGKTAVHEAGHWLNLRHIWGDDYCGNDGVDDTPTQGTYTVGCPTGFRASCGNSGAGDMYMNYMDFTNDACMNLFSLGQKARMRALFETGGPRNSLLTSTGLLPPLTYNIPLPEASPRWLHPQFYPNPAINEMQMDLSYDVRWVGRVLNVINMQGATVMNIVVGSKTQSIPIGQLSPGVYLIYGKKSDGEILKHKFVKAN